MPRAAKVAKYAEKFCRDVESCVKAVEESLRPSLGKKKDVPKPHDAKKLKIWSSLLCAAIKGPEQYSKKIIEVDRLTETLRDTNTREWSFSRQQNMMPHIAEMGMAMPTPMPPADVGESIVAGNGSSDLSRIFSMSSWDDTNSNIMFSAPGSKKAKVLVDGDDGMVTSFSNIDSQFGLSSTSLDMLGMDDYLQLQQDSVACRVRAKCGCATHPRSIA